MPAATYCSAMKLSLYQVDAFASRVFAGNPAAVVPLERWLPDGVLQAIAAENNLSETAFFVGAGGEYEIRWMTPTAEVDLCGHATLASAWVVFNLLEPGRRAVAFRSKSGELRVGRDGERGAAEDRIIGRHLVEGLSGRRSRSVGPTRASSATGLHG